MSVRVEDRGKVELIFFNVPEKLNALSANVRKDVIKVLRDFNTNPEKKVAIITGEGKAFSTGADVTSFSQVLNVTPHEAYEFVYDELKLFHQVIKEIRFSDKIYISVANGVVAGAGFSIFMSCDIRYSSSKTRFITAFHSLGFSPDTGLTLFLSRLVGG